MDYLRWPDYLILVSFFVISIGIGVYHSLTGGRQKTTTEFIMANRSLKVLPTALSLLVSFQSALLILGMTAEMYSYGAMYLVWFPITITVALFLSAQMAVPWMYPLKLVSINEYFERRFHSKAVRILGASISIVFAIFYMGSVMFAPSAALQSATGIPIAFSVPVMAVVSIVYTALGGMRAVIWTDVFQSVIIFGGLLAVLIKGLVVVGGFGNAIQLCSPSGRMNWADWSPDPTVRHTFWGFAFGYSWFWFGFYGISQGAVQRYSATKTLLQAKLSILFNLPAFFVMHLVICFSGLVAVAYYTSIGCDPLINGEISNANQMLPIFVLQIFKDAPGFAGIFLVVLYGGALSSVSTSLSGSAANCWEDILQWKLQHLTESRKALINRLLVVLFGIVTTGFAFMASALPGPITQAMIVLIGATMSPLYGMFLLGGLNRYANWKGALIGTITSLIVSFWLTIGSFTLKGGHPTFPPLSTDGCTKDNNLTFPGYDNSNSSYSIFHLLDDDPVNTTLPTQAAEVPLHGLEKFYALSYLWNTPFGILVTIIAGSIASFLLRDGSEEKVDEKLLINFRECFRFRWNAESESASTELQLVNYKTVVVPSAETTQKTEEPVENHSKSNAEEDAATSQTNKLASEMTH